MVVYMTKTTNLTKKEMFNFLINIVKDSETDCKDMVIDFINNEIALIDKKADSKKPTKTQLENELIKSELFDKLKAYSTDGGTIAKLQTEVEFDKYSNQKLSALLNQLVKDGKVVKEVGKDRKTIFKVEE